MTLDDLRIFIAVCEVGSLSAVARDLQRSQSAVSQHVKALEREVGLALLERQPRGVTPTAAGNLLYEGAVDSLATLNATLRELDRQRHGEGGTLRITTGGPTIRHFIADGVVAFRRSHPDVTLEFQAAHSTRRCLDALRADRADLALITIDGDHHGVEQWPVIDLPWLLVVRDDDPLAAMETAKARDVQQIRYIALPDQSTSQGQLKAHLARREVDLVATTSVADWDTALLLVQLGFGHAIVPSPPAIDLHHTHGLHAVPIEDIPPLTAGWAARNWRSLTPATLEFADTVTRSLQ